MKINVRTVPMLSLRTDSNWNNMLKWTRTVTDVRSYFCCSDWFCEQQRGLREAGSGMCLLRSFARNEAKSSASHRHVQTHALKVRWRGGGWWVVDGG